MTYLIALFGLAGIILNIRKNRLCFVIWIPVNLALAAGNFQAHKPAIGILFCAYAASSVWGLLEWRKRGVLDDFCALTAENMIEIKKQLKKNPEAGKLVLMSPGKKRRKWGRNG